MMFDFHGWINETYIDGKPRHERICFLLEANGGPTVSSWGAVSYGAGHQQGLEQRDALELIWLDAFMDGLSVMGVPVWETLNPLIDSYRVRYLSERSRDYKADNRVVEGCDALPVPDRA